jgi:heme-degrading monooxygenase HmoA
MIAVIFEVWPADGHKQTYLDIAARLKPELEQIDGFLSIERFQSLTDETKLLSLSFWRDEAAVAAWTAHRQRGARLRHDGARRGAGRFTRHQRLGIGATWLSGTT